MKKFITHIVLLCTTFLFVACGGGNNSPEAVAEKFMTAIHKGDVKTASQLIYLSEKDKQTAGVNEKITGKLSAISEQAQAQAKSKGGLNKITIEEQAQYNEDKSRASVRLTLSFKGTESTESGKFDLIKTDDGWKIKL